MLKPDGLCNARILGIQRVHYVPAFTVLGIQRVHYMPAFTILRIQRVHYVPAFTILGIQRVHYVPAFTILGIQRVHYVPAFTNPIYSAASLGEKLSLSPKFLNSKIHEVLLFGFIKPAIMQSKSAFRLLHNIFGRPYPLLCYVGSGYNILWLLNAKKSVWIVVAEILCAVIHRGGHSRCCLRYRAFTFSGDPKWKHESRDHREIETSTTAA